MSACPKFSSFLALRHAMANIKIISLFDTIAVFFGFFLIESLLFVLYCWIENYFFFIVVYLLNCKNSLNYWSPFWNWLTYHLNKTWTNALFSKLLLNDVIDVNIYPWLCRLDEFQFKYYYRKEKKFKWL